MTSHFGPMRIVITGVGVVAPNGIGKDEFWTHCVAGVSGVKPITLFDTSPYHSRWGGEVSDLQPEQHLGSKGLRNLDRTTLLALVAAKLAIDDARLDVTDANRNNIGVVLGSTMGSVHSISEFDKEGLREGPRYVNPAQFPNTVINSPASQVGIRFGLRGLNATISTGFTAALDAFSYAMNMLQHERVTTLLVGGVEELCLQTFLGFYKLGLLAPSENGTPPLFAPFDARRCGTVLGEGAAFFVVESYEQAMSRQVPIYAELLGYGTQFESASMYRYDLAATGPIKAMEEALLEAQIRAEQIDCVSACANANKAGDVVETKAVYTVFGSRASSIPISAVKSMVGESFSAGGALQVAEAVGVLAQQHVPPTIGWQRADAACNIDCVPGTSRRMRVDRVLVNSFGPMGVSSALVLGKG